MAESSRTPTPPNSCSGCDATWTGMAPAHCSGCHRLFASAGLFDQHRKATRGIAEDSKCIDPVTIRKNDIRVMFFREGMWRGPQVSAEDKARMGWRK